MRLAVVLAAALVALGPAPYESELQFCVDRTNTYRATVGLPALKRSEALEKYAATSARVDAESGVPHRYFDRTDGGGVAMAETLIPWWPLSRYGSGARGGQSRPLRHVGRRDTAARTTTSSSAASARSGAGSTPTARA